MKKRLNLGPKSVSPTPAPKKLNMSPKASGMSGRIRLVIADDSDMIRLRGILLDGKFSDAEPGMSPDQIREVLEIQDWYVGPDQDGHWSACGSGAFHPIAGSPGFWRCYMVRGEGIVDVVGYDYIREQIEARSDR